MKYTEKTYFLVDAYDLDEAIVAHYGLSSFDSAAVEKWRNDSSNSFVIKKEALEDYEQDEISALKNGEEGDCSVHIILTDMCNADVIPAGEYLVSVCW